MKFQALTLFLPALALGSPAPLYGRQNGTTTGSPCAEISTISAAAVAAAPSTLPTVSAQLAYDCLTSVPISKTDATALVEAILPYIEWQTDASYLLNPPPAYTQPGTDIHGNLATIISNIAAGTYANEHEFQSSLYASFNLAHDGHFRFSPDLLSKTVSFGRPVSLVSVSVDGVAVPEVYERGDIAAYNALTSGSGNGTSGGNTSMPSIVSKINGEDAVSMLKAWAQLGFLQDPDALYNNVFYSMSFDAQQGGGYGGYFAGSGRYAMIYPGANTTLEFANGTVNTYSNFATVIGNFSGVVDGESAYEKFCTGPHLVPDTSNVTYPFPTAPALPPTATVPAFGYPTPVIISSDDQVSGYFLNENDEKYADVAVLAMLSFEPSWPIEFQSVVETFVSKARAAGKTKLVIDLSGNGGGTILTGYDTFRQLFPNIVQDGFSRFREHEAFNILSEQLSLYSANFDAATANDEHIFAYQSVTDYHYDLNETNGNFLNYDDKFAPHVYNGDNFTNIMRWNLSDPLTTTNSTWGVGETITGYGDRSNFTQPFAAEDIIMVYDGYCASTCTLFSEFMRIQGSVKSIAFGGLPTTGAIQAIGGTKGANNYPYAYIQTLASVPLGTATPDQLANWTALTAYTDLAANRSTDNSLNVRDQILRPNLEDGTPAQFVYEEADCRVFYEPNMISDVTNIWKRVADVTWGGGKCIAGSLPGNETVAVRRRKSEEMKIRARGDEIRVPVDKRWLRSLALKETPTSPVHGRKVPL